MSRGGRGMLPMGSVGITSESYLNGDDVASTEGLS
jgi:hypothetical protein